MTLVSLRNDDNFILLLLFYKFVTCKIPTIVQENIFKTDEGELEFIKMKNF